jgi:hypothetical protein
MNKAREEENLRRVSTFVKAILSSGRSPRNHSMHIIQQNGHPVGAEIDTPVRDAFMQHIVHRRWQMMGPTRIEPIGRLEVWMFDRRGQSFLSSCLAVIFPVLPLAMLTGTNFIAEPLASALNFKESSALRIGANANVARLKKFPPKNAIE